jgi:hypothetical protein
MIMLPPHVDTDRSFAFSEYVRYDAKKPDGTLSNITGTVTTTCLFARSKVLFIYVDGAGGDMQWTRQVSKTWAAAIVAANPSAVAPAAKESASPRHFGRNQVALVGLIGGMIAGICGLIGYLSGRPKTV